MSSEANVAVFADVGSLFYCIDKRYPGRKLDYSRLYDYFVFYGKIFKAIAYGAQIDQEAMSFISCLKRIGFATEYKKFKVVDRGDRKEIRRIERGVDIAMDVVRVLEKVDIVILCSSDPSLASLVTFVKDRGCKCIVLSCGIPKELKEVADQCIEIEEALLEEKKAVAA